MVYCKFQGIILHSSTYAFWVDFVHYYFVLLICRCFNLVAGGLSVSVEGPSKAKISCQDNEDGTCRVTYLPMAPGEYTINLKFMDKNIPGSPYTAKITGYFIFCPCLCVRERESLHVLAYTLKHNDRLTFLFV